MRGWKEEPIGMAKYLFIADRLFERKGGERE